jgi:energy-coupling factor transporter transmembrane protein EcfT
VIAMRDASTIVFPARRRAVPALPLVLVLVAILASMLVPRVSLLGLLSVFPLCSLLFRGRERRARLVRRALSIAPVTLAAAVIRIVCTHGRTPVSLLGVANTAEALVAGAFLAARIGVAASWTTWLASVLGASELDRALVQLAVPPDLVMLFALTRRFAAQLGTTLKSTWAAVALRGGFLSWRTLRRTTGLVAGVVLVRSLDRSHHVGVALALRGGVRR